MSELCSQSFSDHGPRNLERRAIVRLLFVHIRMSLLRATSACMNMSAEIRAESDETDGSMRAVSGNQQGVEIKHAA